MKNGMVWMNGRFVDIDKAKVPISDRGFLYGDGVFETMRSYAGVIFRLDRHLDRLFGAFRVMKMDPPYAKKYLRGIAYRVLKANNLKSAYIRMAVTRGEGRFGIGYRDIFTPNTVVVAKEFEEYPRWMHKRGISAKVVDLRQNELSPLSGIKSLNFMPYILARLHAKEEGFDEAILANTKGHIAEAATSNIFIVRGYCLITPSLESGILPGITRGAVIEIAKRLKMRVIEKPVTRGELLGADEVFLTNSLAEVLPVRAVDSKRIGKGAPGDVTRLLRIAYQKQVIAETVL
ncbi:MAG: aminotransferase class IV [Candidatus Omnitrophota bacterium]